MAADAERQEPKQVEQESDHRAEIVAGSEPTDQPLDRRARFGEGQGAESSGKASTICWAVQAAVGCSVTLKWTTRRRR